MSHVHVQQCRGEEGPASPLDIHEEANQPCLQREEADGEPRQSDAGHSCCSLLPDSMRRMQVTARRQWARRRGKFKPTPKYIFLYGVLPLGLVIYTFLQLSDIFIDFAYYSDVHVPCYNLTKPISRIQVFLDSQYDGETEAAWQTVVYNQTYVLSAYLDRREDLGGKYLVRILGITNTYTDSYPPTSYCQLWYHDSIIMESVRARRYVIEEHHDLRFAPIIYSCIVPDINRLPQFVSLTSHRCAIAPNLMLIEHSNLSSSSFQVNFTLCVAPFVHGYSRIKQLIEMVEVASLFGADNLIFYNYSGDPSLHTIFDYYRLAGRVQLHQWKVPVSVGEETDVVKPELHYYGQVVALNDCYYRNLYRSRYTVVMDLDEVIVPHKANSWTEMMASFPSKMLVIDYGAYVFRNVFFVNPSRETDEPDTKIQEQNAQTNILASPQTTRDVSCLKTSLREPKVYPAYKRSKYIADNKNVVALGIHFPFQFTESTTYEYIVPPSVGVLHHYRQDRYRNKSYPDSYYTRDETLFQFSDSILSNIIQTHDGYKKFISDKQSR